MAMHTGIGVSKILILVGAGISHYFSSPKFILSCSSYDLNPIFYHAIVFVFTGYTSTILLKNGKLSDVLGELQVWIFLILVLFLFIFSFYVAWHLNVFSRVLRCCSIFI